MAKKILVEEKESQENSSVFLLFGEINNDSARDTCAWILDCNFSSENRPEILNLIVNSPGGDLNHGYAIIDIMKSSRIPIRTIGLGSIQSAGLMIFLTGTKGQRILTPNTSIMSHQYSWGSGGKHHELIAVQKEFDLTYERMMNHYITTTGMKEKDIKKYLLPSEDVYLSAQEAQKFGICDKVAFM